MAKIALTKEINNLLIAKSVLMLRKLSAAFDTPSPHTHFFSETF